MVGATSGTAAVSPPSSPQSGTSVMGVTVIPGYDIAAFLYPVFKQFVDKDERGVTAAGTLLREMWFVGLNTAYELQKLWCVILGLNVYQRSCLSNVLTPWWGPSRRPAKATAPYGVDRGGTPGPGGVTSS
jgi:hypothetical protein